MFVDVPFSGSGTLDCRPLQEASRRPGLGAATRHCLLTLAASSANLAAVPALELLRVLAGRGPVLLPWLGVCCWQLGRRLEAKIWNPDKPLAAMPSDWRDGCSVRASDAADTIAQRDRRLWVNLCGTQQMTCGVQHLSCAVDASRIGKRHLLLGVVVHNEDNRAQWMLPQDH